MEGRDRRGESMRDAWVAAVASRGSWSRITAIVGVAAVVAGGITYLLVNETRSFSVTVLIIGFALLATALALSPRAAATSLAGRRGRHGANSLVITVAFLTIVVLVNFQIFRSPGRLDLTFTRVFTLAPQTAQALETLDATVRANAFFVPGESVRSRQQVEDMLGEFERRTDRFSYRFIDPELNASLARQYDVTSYPSVVFEELTTKTQQSAFGFTEQDFVTSILVVTGEKRKRVYYLTGHKELFESRGISIAAAPDDGLDSALAGLRRDNYSVASLNLAETGEVPGDAAVLVIAGPRQDLSSSDAEALELYIRNGGRVLGMFDPGTPETFTRLLARWGVKLGDHSIADLISNVGGEVLTPLVQRSNAQFLPGPPSIPITDRLSVAFFPDVAPVETLLPPEDMPPRDLISFHPLAMTTPGSWLETDTESPEFDSNEDTRGPFPVAVAVETSGAIDGTERHALAKFVIFGDSDFATNRYFASMDNGDFLLNSVNWLAEDFDLISIPSRVTPSRRLVVNRRERDFIKWSGWTFPPSVMLLLGVYVWWRRR